MKFACLLRSRGLEIRISNLREPLIIINLSLPRRRESSDVKSFWIPAFAGMTFLEVAFINDRVLRTKERDSVSRPNFSFPHHEDTVAAGTGEGEGRIARS